MHVYFWAVLMFGLSVFGASAQGTGDCPLKESDIKPVISAFNPLFSDHYWLAASKQEVARLDANRVLAISQKGCLRHHKLFVLVFPRGFAKTDDAFWLAEARQMFKAVYFDRQEYALFGAEFEYLFAQRLALTGLNEEFNFPLATRNFLCKVVFGEAIECKLEIEVIDFVFEQEVILAPILDPKDDGRYQKPSIAPVPDPKN